jgi:hypothetical protein
MKLPHLLTACAVLLTLAPSPAAAQTSAVPAFISYQGRVVDATGANVGTGTPVNRTVIFRIWDNPSSTNIANLIYSEVQTVTVSEGEFSVLVGQGVANSTQTYGYLETSKKLTDIGSAFGGSTRYLGVTVASTGTIATTDNEITPRQQIVSTAFAMRAKYAEQVGSNGTAALTALDSGNVGIGTLAPPALFTVSGANVSTSTTTPQLLVTADDLTERLRIGVDSTNNGTGFIQAFKEGVGAQNLLLNPNGGNVGIGTTAPVARLDIIDGTTAGSYGSAMITRPTNSHTGSHMAFVRSGAQIMGVGYAPSVNTFGFGQGVSGVAFSPGYLAIDQNNSFVGIGTASPGYKLDVRGNGRFTDTLTTDAPIVMGPGSQIYGSTVAGGSKPVFWPRAADDATYLNIGSNGWYVRDDANNVTMRLTSGGRLGLGTSTPANLLQVQAPISAQVATGTVAAGNAVAAIGASDAGLHFGSYNNNNGYGSWIQSMRTWDNYSFNLVLNPNGGNVGIGKSLPSVPLDVTGAVKASTTIAAGTTITAGGAIAAGTTITAGGKSVPVSDEADLKIVRGTVTAAGGRVVGTGFSVVKVAGNGLYQITFTTAFSASPTITTSITGRYGLKAEVYDAGRTTFPPNGTDGLYPGAGGFTVGILNSNAEAAYNFGFSFIAIGPR